MIRVGILGATGYTAAELIRLLLRHDQARIVAATTRQEPRPLASVLPELTARLDLTLTNQTPAEVAADCDCVFSCLPHTASSAAVPELLAAGTRVVDFSADYRLNDVPTYEHWYGVTHPDPDRVPSTVYGLPELFRASIPAASLVANPGCYPTSAILPLAPLIREKLIEPRGVIVNAVSGLSGAGKSPKPHLHFPEANESVTAYALGTHRHMPEIDQILERGTGVAVECLFTPHLVPMDRGILATIYAAPTATLPPDVLQARVMELWREAYRNEPFVRVVAHPPNTKHVAGTNFCDISARVVRGRLVLLSVIDNLVKGASGAAVQNFNLMFGFPETTALL